MRACWINKEENKYEESNFWKTGKTEKLIKLAADTGGTIITFNRESSIHILHRAHKMGLPIQEPIDINTLMRDTYQNGIAGKITNVIVDDADQILEIMLRKFNVISIDAISICTDDPSDELI